MLLLLSTLFALASPGITAPVEQSQHIPANPYGVNVFLHKEVEAWKIEQTLKMVADANIQWVKQQFPWQEIEFQKNYFHDDKWNKSAWEKFDRIVDLAAKYKLNLVARVDKAPEWAKGTDGTLPLKSNQDLADFINALLDHYEGRLRYVQVWNEPNLSGEWVPGKPVNPAQYADMMKTVYPAVKARHPDAIILSAPLAITLDRVESRGNMNELQYWDELYKASIKGNFDIASANGYGLDQPPTAAPDPKKLNFRRVELLHDIMARNGDTSPVWFNEYAWNASPATLAESERLIWRNVTPKQQAEWTVEGIEYARKNWPWAGTFFIWYFRQVGDIPPDKAEYYFGMVDPEFKPQPVYGAVKGAAGAYAGPVVAQPAPATPTSVAPRPTETASPIPTVPPTATATTQVEPTATFTALVTDTATVEPTSTIAATATSATTATAAATVQITSTTVRPTPSPTEVAAVQGASGGNNALLVLGALLVLAGLGLGYYLMRGRRATVTKVTRTEE